MSGFFMLNSIKSVVINGHYDYSKRIASIAFEKDITLFDQ